MLGLDLVVTDVKETNKKKWVLVEFDIRNVNKNHSVLVIADCSEQYFSPSLAAMVVFQQDASDWT